MTTELNVGDKVRVKSLAANGVIRSVSTRLRHTPYLVDVSGYGERSYAAEDLQKLPSIALPPAAPVQAVRGATGVMVCGVVGCWRIIDPAQPTCTKCGAKWVLP